MLAGSVKNGYTLDEQDAITYWHKDPTGQLTSTPVTGQQVIRRCVGRGSGQGRTRVYPLDCYIPEGDDTEYEYEFFAEILRFLYVMAGGSSEPGSDNTAPNNADDNDSD